MFNLKAGNHEVILTSGFFDSKDAALAGIGAVQVAGQKDASFERKTSAASEPFFTLNGADGTILGKSEMYTSSAASENGISSVRSNCLASKVVDLTAQQLNLA